MLDALEADLSVSRGAFDVFLTWADCLGAVVVDKMKVLVVSYHYKLINHRQITVCLL